MLRQNTGPATIAANSTSASMPSWSCSLTRCSGPPVPAASATLSPKGCQVPAARPARKSRKLASRSDWPSIISASPPSGRWIVCGARSRYFCGTRWVQRSGGTSRCPSADISLYCFAISPTPSIAAGHLSKRRGRGNTPRPPRLECHHKPVILVPVLAARRVALQFEIVLFEPDPVRQERAVVRHFFDCSVDEAALPDEAPLEGELLPAEPDAKDHRRIFAVAEHSS